MEVKASIFLKSLQKLNLWRVIVFWNLKAKKAHFEKTEVKIFGAAFEKKIYTVMNVNRRINDDSKMVSDADQHPEVHLAGNDYRFALICKENQF